MTRQRTSLTLATIVVLLLFTSALPADTRIVAGPIRIGTVIGSHHGGIGFWIGTPPPPPLPYVPVPRPVIVAPPWRHRFVRIGPPACHEPVVIARPPVQRPVVIHPAPPVCNTEVVVWITNSNGSKTSVKLTRQGRWYIGPRGEYYDQMPTNEQLRLAYGF